MGRRLADATKACRMRRTRGEMGCDLWALVERGLAVVAAGFFGEVILVVVFFAGPGFAGLAELWSGLAGEAA
jgi:hypothetical protein